MGGSSGDNDPGMYNHTGSTGIPASRVAPASWVDAVGDFWIFGGSSSTQGTSFSSTYIVADFT